MAMKARQRQSGRALGHREFWVKTKKKTESLVNVAMALAMVLGLFFNIFHFTRGFVVHQVDRSLRYQPIWLCFYFFIFRADLFGGATHFPAFANFG